MNDVVQLVGTFVKVSLKSTVTLEISNQSVVTLLETQTGSEGSEIKLLGNAVLEQIILQAAAKVTGEGTILKAVINAEGVSFEQIVNEYTLSELVKLVLIAGNEVTEDSVPPVVAPSTIPGSTNTSPAPDEGSTGDAGSPGQPADGEPIPEPGDVQEINAAFIVQDKLYTLYPTIEDYSTVQWDVTNTVTKDTYQTEYAGTLEDTGIYSIPGGTVAPAPYDVTNRSSTQHYSGALLSSITVNDSVYAHVYYGGDEMISYQINDSYVVHDLGNQLPEQAVSLAAGDSI